MTGNTVSPALHEVSDILHFCIWVKEVALSGISRGIYLRGIYGMTKAVQVLSTRGGVRCLTPARQAEYLATVSDPVLV